MSPSNERSAEGLRGAVAVMGGMVDEGSTVFDSDLPHITQGNLEDYLAEYAELLAAAEAREATQPSAAEVIEACRMALEEVLDALRDDMPLDAAMAHGDTALALIAKWKEVQ